jgi:2-methylcitrate dehydratase PrpD
MMQLTEKVVNFITRARYDTIPEAVLQQAKAGILDWFFVSLGGRQQAGGAVRNFMEMTLAKGGTPESSLIGSLQKATENQAALINGCIGHIMDYDETCPKVRSHLFAAIFPALLAAGELRGVTGKQLLEGFVTGHEVAMRIGEAITPSWIKAGWHGTSLFGIFGAAAGCAKLMGLDARRIRMALGLVCSMASGVAVNFGSLAKPLHAGMAAERGLFAAQLAQSGFTASQRALESALGFYHAYNWGEVPNHAVFESLGNPWGLETPGISSIKLYPCCHGLATNIECGIRIHEKYHLTLDDIESVEMHSQPKTLCAMLSRNYEDTGEGLQWGYQGPPRQMQSILPTTGAQAKFSKEYAFSKAVRDGAVLMEDLTDEAVNEPEIRKWMARIKLYHNSELETYSNQYPEETAPHAERMVVHLKNGSVITEEEIFIRGMTKRPLAFDDVKFKYHDCGGMVGMDSVRIEEIIEVFRHLETVDNVADVITQISLGK